MSETIYVDVNPTSKKTTQSDEVLALIGMKNTTALFDHIMANLLREEQQGYNERPSQYHKRIESRTSAIWNEIQRMRKRGWHVRNYATYKEVVGYYHSDTPLPLDLLARVKS